MLCNHVGYVNPGNKVIHNQELMLFQRTWRNFNRLPTTKDWQKFQNSFSECSDLFFGILMQGSGKGEDSGCYNVLEVFCSMKREKQLLKSSCEGPARAILGHSLLLDPAADFLSHRYWLLFNFEQNLYLHFFTWYFLWISPSTYKTQCGNFCMKPHLSQMS